MRYRSGVVGLLACGVLVVGSVPATGSSNAAPPTDPQHWRLVAQEGFDRPLRVDEAPWVKDPQGPSSPWHVDQFDDEGEVWHAISDPYFSRALDTFGVFRKRVTFGTRGWLTAEIAAQDKNNDGRPDSQPGLRTVTLPGGEHAAEISEPSWDAGVLIRPTRPLPPRYRVEVTLRGIDFGGKRNGTLRYDGKFNGYRQTGCKAGRSGTTTRHPRNAMAASTSH